MELDKHVSIKRQVYSFLVAPALHCAQGISGFVTSVMIYSWWAYKDWCNLWEYDYAPMVKHYWPMQQTILLYS
jgi:hypothetical protein